MYSYLPSGRANVYLSNEFHENTTQILVFPSELNNTFASGCQVFSLER